MGVMSTQTTESPRAWDGPLMRKAAVQAVTKLDPAAA
jgi:hypothetical protein